MTYYVERGNMFFGLHLIARGLKICSMKESSISEITGLIVTKCVFPNTRGRGRAT
jgi:hypothetical protein